MAKETRIRGTCPQCGSTNYKKFRDVRRRSFKTQVKFYYSCLRCKSNFYVPMKVEKRVCELTSAAIINQSLKSIKCKECGSENLKRACSATYQCKDCNFMIDVATVRKSNQVH
jgi:hypothetical protein